ECVERDAFAGAVASVVGDHGVDLLVPCSDASAQILWEQHDRLGGARILGGDRRSFELAVDKSATLDAAERAGFPVPRWCAPKDDRDALRFAEASDLPLVVKPRGSFVEREGRLVQRRHGFVHVLADLEPLLRGLAEADGRLPLLEEYVLGRSVAV